MNPRTACTCVLLLYRAHDTVGSKHGFSRYERGHKTKYDFVAYRAFGKAMCLSAVKRLFKEYGRVCKRVNHSSIKNYYYDVGAKQVS